VKSRRPLTAVLSGPRPTASVMDAMSKICRVLPVASSEPGQTDAMIKNWLAVLTPLNLPQGIDNIAEPMLELQRAVGNGDPVAAQLIAASSKGEEAVETLLHEKIAEALVEDEADQ
jgi:hypothetical protein